MNKERIFSLIQTLQTSRPARDHHRLFVVEGIRNFLRAFENGYTARVILHSDLLCKSSLIRQTLRQINAPVLRLSPEEFRRLSQTEHASGIAAILEQQVSNLKTVQATDPSWIVLHQIRNAGNFGTLIRSANASGNTGFILLEQSIEPFSPATVRASMGGIYQQRFVRASPVQLQEFLEQHGFMAVGASPDATLGFQEFQYPKPTFLMLGEERKGLSLEQRKMCQAMVRIPMQPHTDSLNLGVAGSLLLYAVHQPLEWSRGLFEAGT